jgi:macrolide-specific efflux system membrane fusion protein
VVRVLMPDGTAQPRNVDTGISDNMKVQVLAGLSDGDKVIIGWPAAPTLVQGRNP